MGRFSLQYTNYSQNIKPFLNDLKNLQNLQNIKPNLNDLQNIQNIKSNKSNKPIFDKNMNYYICSYGGSGSTILFKYLSNFGNVKHIHDRYPPVNLSYIGNTNTTENVYSEWFNNIEIPKDKLQNYKVIFIYRNPIPVIYSRFINNKNHLNHIKCDNNGEINLFDVLKYKKDLYKLENFFDEYTTNNKKYDVYCIKYELFWNNIEFFNNVMNIPNIQELYPIKIEHPKKYKYNNQLSIIYNSLIQKMNKMPYIKIIKSNI